MSNIQVVHLVPYRLDHAQAMVEAARESAADVQPWLPWCHPAYSIEEALSWLQTQVAAFEKGEAYEFAIMSADGRYQGGCGINRIDKAERRANLGYWVRSSATGRGVATAAVRALTDWAFAATELVRLELVVAVTNAASCRVAEKAGAVREGALRKSLHEGWLLYDSVVFSLAKE